MAVSVAPLTTTVMGSVKEQQAGVASGINNAVSRTAGLLAIAIFGVGMLQTFSRTLDQHLTTIYVREGGRQSLLDQSVKLGGFGIAPELWPENRREL